MHYAGRLPAPLLLCNDKAALASPMSQIPNAAAPAMRPANHPHVPRGFARKVGSATVGSSGQGCRG